VRSVNLWRLVDEEFDVVANATPTLSLFVMAAGDIPREPASNRILVGFLNTAGDEMGASSITVTARRSALYP